MPSVACPSEAELSQLFRGAVSAEAIQQLEEHAAGCPVCLASIKQTMAQDDTLGQLDKSARHSSVSQHPELPALMQRIAALAQTDSLSKIPRDVQDAPATSERNPYIAEDAPAPPWELLAPAERADELGRIGKYRVLRVLGQGGMGVVFEAEDPDLRRRVALKAMLPTVAAKPRAKQRFLREARAAAALKHDHIVTIHQVDEDRSVPYITMEYLEGESLEARLDRQKQPPLADLYRIGREIAAGLAAAHDQGLIHRDIKPGNIWLERRPGMRADDFRVKLLDFGLAHTGTEHGQLTGAGIILGTPSYMSPEQAVGKPVDARSDLFSLGVVLYALATGVLPFRGEDTVDVLTALPSHVPPVPVELNAELPPGLSQLIVRLLAKDPRDRPASAHAVADELRQLEAGQTPTPLESATATRPIPAPKSARRRSVKGLIALAAGVLLGALSASSVFFLPRRNGVVRVESNDPRSKAVTPTPPTPVAWQPTPEQQAFLDATARLPIKNRIEAVQRRLREINPNEPISLNLEPKDAEPIKASINAVHVTEVWPLAALTSLTSLDVTQTSVLDFRSLARLPLTELRLNLILDNLASESALKSIATLQKINDRPVKEFWAERAAVRSEIEKLAPVAHGLSPEDLTIWVRSVLQKLHPQLPADVFGSLKVIDDEVGRRTFNGHDVPRSVFDFSPIRALSVERFALVAGGLIDAAPLGQTKLKVIQMWKGFRIDLTKLAGLPMTRLELCGSYSDLRPLQGMPLKHLRISGTSTTDLATLKGMPLETLELPGVPNLAPLAGLPLKRLSMGLYCPVSDLSPLNGMPLESLTFQGSKVSDLSPLRGMKLKELGWWGSPVADLRPLEGMPLTTLDVGRANLDPVLATLPLKELHVVLRLHSEAEEKVLRGLKLEKINGMSPTDFWADIEQRRRADAARTAAAAKVPLEVAALEKALWDCGQYPKVTIDNGKVVAAAMGHSGTTFAPLAAFPTLRKLSLTSGGDYSPLVKLTQLEELNCPPQEAALNRPVLRLLPKLTTINGKPASEVLK